MGDDAGQTVNTSGSDNSNSDDSDFWPQSYKVYNVTVVMPMVAHSESQAKKRTEDLMHFLLGWRSNAEGSHPVTLYIFDDPTVQDVHYSHEDTFESRKDMGVGMVSDREFLYDWWNPDSDADYDPWAFADATYFCRGEEDEVDPLFTKSTNSE